MMAFSRRHKLYSVLRWLLAITFIEATLLLVAAMPAIKVAGQDIGRLVDEPPERRYYLCTFIGTGTSDDPFEPAIADYAASWAMIDLRPDPTVVSGFCLAYADNSTIINIPQAVYITDSVYDIDGTVGYYLNNVFTINISGGNLADYLANLLRSPPALARANLCKPLQPESDGQYRIYLGGQIWGEPETLNSHSTFTDDFNRASLGSDWTEVRGNWSIYDSDDVWNEGGGDSGYLNALRCNVAMVTDDHYSQIDDVYGQDSESWIGPCVRFHASDETYYTFQNPKGTTKTSYITKVIAGTDTNIASSGSSGVAPPKELRLEVDGSSLTAYIDDGELLSTTDTDITGNLYHGLASNWYFDSRGDDYEADDIGAGPTAPTVVTNTPNSVLTTSANVSGNITATGGENPNWAGFIYDDDGSPYANNQGTSGNYSVGEFTENLTGLTVGTKYHIIASANNSAGSGNGTEVTFITLPTDITNFTSTATSNNSISFEWTVGTGADYTEIRYASGASPPTDNTSGTLGFWGSGNTTAVSGLSPGTQYSFSAFAIAEDEDLQSCSAGYDTATDYTNPGDPYSLATSNPTASSLDLDWTKGANSDNTVIRRKEGSYPTDYNDGDLAYSDTGSSTTDSGLSPSTTYYYRAWAYDVASGYYSENYTQDTGTTTAGIVVPTVTTSAATLVEETTATLNGNITDTGGENCTRHFQWDTDLSSPYADNWTDAGTHGTGAYSHGLTGLNRGDKYIFRATANNTEGFGYGSLLYFMTKPNPATSFASPDKGTTWIYYTWSNGDGMDYVELRYAEGASPPSDNTSGTLGYWGTGTSVNVTGLNPGTQYSARIFTHAYEDGTWSLADSNPTDTETTDIGLPTITNGTGASNVTHNSARLNGELTDDGGGSCNVTVFCGTVDGGTSPSSWNWTYELGIQSVGVFYQDSGENLTPETLHYYRYRVVNEAGTDWADSSANFTTTAYSPAVYSPTGFTLTDLGAITVNIAWTPDATANYTMIRVSREDYPTSTTDGELVYYGPDSTVNTTGYSLDLNTFYFVAIGFASDNITYSEEFTQAEIGGEGMTEVADSIDGLVEVITAGIIGDSSYLAFLIVAFIMAMIFWKGGVVLKSIGVSVALVYGLTMASSRDIYSAMWVAGVAIALVGLYFLYDIVAGAWGKRKKERQHEQTG